MDSLLNLQFWGTWWFILLGFTLFVFMVLDGFDLGVGMLLPFFSKRPQHQVLAVNAIWPVWDGNELWGLVGAGCLLVAFPAVFNLVLVGFYPIMTLFLVCLMFRPVIFEVWFHSIGNRVFWQKMFALVSFGIIFLLGVVIGNLQGGMTLAPDAHGVPVFAGSLLSLLNPFALVTGLFLAVACLVHGAAWLIVKLEGESRVDAKLALARNWVILVIVTVLWLLLLFITLPASVANPGVWILAVLMLADLVLIRVLAGHNVEKRIFVLTSGLFGLFWLMQATSQFLVSAPYPVVARALNNPGLSLHAGNAGGNPATMSFLGVVAPLILAGVLVYTVVVYRIFKGKVKAEAEY